MSLAGRNGPPLNLNSIMIVKPHLCRQHQEEGDSLPQIIDQSQKKAQDFAFNLKQEQKPAHRIQSLRIKPYNQSSLQLQSIIPASPGRFPREEQVQLPNITILRVRTQE
jgi:hypothetical protein